MRKKLKLVHGVGVNDADYVTVKKECIAGKQRTVWSCPFYVKWKEMLRRCYDKLYHNRQPTYKDCTVVDEWLYFSNFKAWMETQDWENKYLDKDLLVPFNKEYGPETCIFVSRKVNGFLLERTKCRGDLPIGVSMESRGKRRYRATCSSVETGKNKIIGRFFTATEAHKAWLSFKLKQAYILAEQQDDQRVANALIERYKNYSSLIEIWNVKNSHTSAGNTSKQCD